MGNLAGGDYSWAISQGDTSAESLARGDDLSSADDAAVDAAFAALAYFHGLSGWVNCEGAFHPLDDNGVSDVDVAVGARARKAAGCPPRPSDGAASFPRLGVVAGGAFFDASGNPKRALTDARLAAERAAAADPTRPKLASSRGGAPLGFASPRAVAAAVDAGNLESVASSINPMLFDPRDPPSGTPRTLVEIDIAVRRRGGGGGGGEGQTGPIDATMSLIEGDTIDGAVHRFISSLGLEADIGPWDVERLGLIARAEAARARVLPTLSLTLGDDEAGRPSFGFDVYAGDDPLAVCHDAARAAGITDDDDLAEAMELTRLRAVEAKLLPAWRFPVASPMTMDDGDDTNGDSNGDAEGDADSDANASLEMAVYVGDRVDDVAAALADRLNAPAWWAEALTEEATRHLQGVGDLPLYAVEVRVVVPVDNLDSSVADADGSSAEPRAHIWRLAVPVHRGETAEEAAEAAGAALGLLPGQQQRLEERLEAASLAMRVQPLATIHPTPDRVAMLSGGVDDGLALGAPSSAELWAGDVPHRAARRWMARRAQAAAEAGWGEDDVEALKDSLEAVEAWIASALEQMALDAHAELVPDGTWLPPAAGSARDGPLVFALPADTCVAGRGPWSPPGLGLVSLWDDRDGLNVGAAAARLGGAPNPMRLGGMDPGSAPPPRATTRPLACVLDPASSDGAPPELSPASASSRARLDPDVAATMERALASSASPSTLAFQFCLWPGQDPAEASADWLSWQGLDPHAAQAEVFRRLEEAQYDREMKEKRDEARTVMGKVGGRTVGLRLSDDVDGDGVEDPWTPPPLANGSRGRAAVPVDETTGRPILGDGRDDVWPVAPEAALWARAADEAHNAAVAAGRLPALSLSAIVPPRVVPKGDGGDETIPDAGTVLPSYIARLDLSLSIFESIDHSAGADPAANDALGGVVDRFLAEHGLQGRDTMLSDLLSRARTARLLPVAVVPFAIEGGGDVRSPPLLVWAGDDLRETAERFLADHPAVGETVGLGALLSRLRREVGEA